MTNKGKRYHVPVCDDTTILVRGSGTPGLVGIRVGALVVLGPLVGEGEHALGTGLRQTQPRRPRPDQRLKKNWDFTCTYYMSGLR